MNFDAHSRFLVTAFVATSLIFGLSGQGVRADDSIFGARPGSAELPVASTPALNAAAESMGLAESPTIQQRPGDVLRAADAKVERMAADGVITAGEKSEIKGWFRDLPFHRIVDVKISFLSGFPDLIGICLQGNPSQYLSVDACAGSIVFVSALSAHVTSRFLQYVDITGKTNADGSVSYSGNEFGVGPSVGYRSTSVASILGGNTGTAQGIDALISAEWVHWISRYFGLGLTLDAGATFYVSQENGANQAPVVPNIKLSLGLSF